MFKNGNAISNVYAADARKLSTFYTTQVTPQFAPRDMTTANLLSRVQTAVAVAAIPQRAQIIEEVTGTHYIGNFEYSIMENETTLKRIHNAEGYVENGQYFYYRKDWLGNNREVWNATTQQTVQVTNYYSSGLPWNYEVDIAQQQYKYNGHEYIEDFGLDTYSYGFRDYYAAIGRFTSIDPMAEGTYSQGCYNYANGNPVANIDFMGLFASGGMGTTYYEEPDLSDFLGEGDITGIGDIIKNIEDLLDKLTGGKGQGSLGGTLGGGGSKTITANVPVTISIGGKAITVMVQTEMQVGFDMPVLSYSSEKKANRVNNRRYGGKGKVGVNSKGEWFVQAVVGNGYNPSVICDYGKIDGWGIASSAYSVIVVGGAESQAYRTMSDIRKAGLSTTFAAEMRGISNTIISCAEIGGWVLDGVVGGVQIGFAVAEDGGRFGYNAQRTTAGVVGGAGGGALGTWGGAAAGAAVGAWFAGVGAVPGGIIGGIIGGIGGSWGGSSIGTGIYDWFH